MMQTSSMAMGAQVSAKWSLDGSALTPSCASMLRIPLTGESSVEMVKLRKCTEKHVMMGTSKVETVVRVTAEWKAVGSARL